MKVKQLASQKQAAVLYCPICTRYVDGQIQQAARRNEALPGQKCPHCSASLDAAAVVHIRQAA